MGRIVLYASLVVFLGACGSKTAKQDTTPVGGGGGDSGGGDSGDGDGDTAKCEPGRCLEDISKLIAERRPDARACYDNARKRDPKLQGKIIINFAIDSEGMVGETSQGMQDGQIEDQEVVACVTEVIKTVRFAASATGRTTRAYHRFEFSP
jgi:hypothetical protein